MLFRWLVTTSCGHWLFIAVAALASALYGWNCWTINELDWNDCDQEKQTKRWDEGTTPWKVHQVWLNTLGSLFGWWAFWLLLLDYQQYRDSPDHHALRYADIVLAAVAFLGMTGYLPKVSRYGSKLFPSKD
jgi:hypothetical protein